MSVIDRIARSFGFEKRSSLENPSTPLSYPAEWLMDIFNGGRTDSGVRVSEMTALQVSTVLACVNIISNGVSSLPLNVYERQQIKDGRQAKKIAFNHNLHELLSNEPNPEMGSVIFRKTLQAHALLWGNAYFEVQRSTNDNSILALWPRNPAKTRPVRLLSDRIIEGEKYPGGTLVYETHETVVGSLMDASDNKADASQARLVLAEDMVHIPGLSLDGRLGQPTVQLARQVIGLALATEKYSAKFFGNNARPAGILSLPGTLTELARENLKRSWSEGHGGENTHKTAILEQGVQFTKIASTPEEAQNLQSRAFQRQEIAALFSVPAHMVGETEKSAGKSTVEQSSLEFLLYCLNPWLSVWTNETKRKLFPKTGRSAGKYFPGFDTRSLTYPDAESRSKLYAAGKQNGFLSSNDIREIENLNPIEDGSGDTYWMPLTMRDAAAPTPEPTPAPETK